MKAITLRVGLLALLSSITLPGHTKPHETTPPLANAVILIIRHAEKPEQGDGLAPAGQRRAYAYVRYFENFIPDGKLTGRPLHFDSLFAAADSAASHRPRLTLAPLSRVLDLPLNAHYRDKDFAALAADLRAKNHGHNILICWHHGKIPDLVSALGADPAQLLPHSTWPKGVYNWVLQLRYDQNGHLMPAATRRIRENLLPDDATKPAP